MEIGRALTWHLKSRWSILLLCSMYNNYTWPPFRRQFSLFLSFARLLTRLLLTYLVIDFISPCLRKTSLKLLFLSTYEDNTRKIQTSSLWLPITSACTERLPRPWRRQLWNSWLVWGTVSQVLTLLACCNAYRTHMAACFSRWLLIIN